MRRESYSISILCGLFAFGGLGMTFSGDPAGLLATAFFGFGAWLIWPRPDARRRD
jgi:hypothetical protein